MLRGLMHRWPALLRATAGRQNAYERALTLMARPPAGVDIHVIAPPEDFRVTRYTRERELLEDGYRQGREHPALSGGGAIG